MTEIVEMFLSLGEWGYAVLVDWGGVVEMCLSSG